MFYQIEYVKVIQEKTWDSVASAQNVIFWRPKRQQHKDDWKIVGADKFFSSAGTTMGSRTEIPDSDPRNTYSTEKGKAPQ